MSLCVRLLCVCPALRACRGLATDSYPDQGDQLTVHRIRTLNKWPGPNKGCRIIDELK
jgi:hypothetical protein